MEQYFFPRETKRWIRLRVVETLAGVLSGVVILSSPLLLLVIWPLWVYRRVISILASWVDPTLSRMLSPLEAGMAARSPYSAPFCNIVQTAYISGRVTKEEVVSAVEVKLFGKKPVYPELSQELVTRFGFKFWKRSKNFKVSNHVRIHFADGRLVDGEDVKRVMEELLKSPFPPGQSLWELVILQNVHDSRRPLVNSVVFLRGHHSLFDGFGVVRLFQKLSEGPVSLPELPKMPTVPWFLKGVVWGLDTVRLPYVFLHHFVSQDRNFYTAKAACPVGKVKVGETALIEMSKMREIKRRYGIPMTVVVHTVFLGGFINFMKRKNRIVRDIKVGMPIANPGRPDKMVNSFSAAYLNLQIFEDNILRTMESIPKEVRHFSARGRAFALASSLFGGLPVALSVDANKAPKMTILLSSFPGSRNKVDFCGHPIQEFSSAFTPGRNLGMGAMAFSYNDKFKYTFFADESVFSSSADLDCFSAGMADTINQLLDLRPVTRKGKSA